MDVGVKSIMPHSLLLLDIGERSSDFMNKS